MLLVAGLSVRQAQAWVETDVLGHQATIVVSKEGQAEIRHQLIVKLRGGPLESLDIEGVGATLETLEDAVVRKAQSGSASVWPLVLESREDGTLHLSIEAEKGLRGGTYQFEFGYRVGLAERGWLERRGDRVRLTWVGPRFSGGVDSAKVLLRVPQSAVTPSLPEAEDGPAAGVLLSQVRRSASFDEVELVRAHLARGEPAVWQIEVGAEPFATAIAEGSHVRGPQAVAPPPRTLELPKAPRWAWALSIGLGLLYFAATFRKARAFEQSCRAAGATSRPLLPLPSLVRSLVGGTLLGAAAGLGLTESPTLAGACLALAILSATLLPPVRAPRARGPGEWSKLADEEHERVAPPVQMGRLLDASSVPGFLVFLALIAASSVLAWILLPRSTYQAGLVVIGSAALLPLFFTGRRADMPPDAAFGALPIHRYFAKKLANHPDVTSEIWARRPLGGGEPDELRLRLMLDGARPGLRAIEIGVELGVGLIALPCVVVRVVDDSEAYKALPHGVVWVRGRSSEERVAILRPRAPSRAGCLRLALEVLHLERAGTRDSAERYDGRKSSRMSAGSGAVTAKAGTPATSHAT